MSSRTLHWRDRAVTASEAAGHLKSGDRVFVHGAAATPTELLEAACARTDLADVELYHLHTNGPAPFADPGVTGRLHSNSLFVGPLLRRPVEEGRADFIPIFLSDIPGLFSRGIVPLDVALLSLSPPDRQGNCTLGTSVDAARAAADSGAHGHCPDQRADAAHARQRRGSPGALARFHGGRSSPLGVSASPADRDGAADRRDRRPTDRGRLDPAGRNRWHPGRCPCAPARQARPGRAHGDVLRWAHRPHRERGRHQPLQGSPPGPHRRELRERNRSAV